MPYFFIVFVLVVCYNNSLEGWCYMEPYLEIINHFGYRAQMKKLNEECFEFLEAVDNYEDFDVFFSGEADLDDLKQAREFVIEEMGDMLILLTQFLARYHITKDEVDRVMDYKLDRTLSRISEGYYDSDEEDEESYE